MSTAPGTSMNKVYASARHALTGLSNGASLLVGGYAGHEEPETLIEAVITSGVRDLTVVCHGAGAPGSGRSDLNRLVETGAVRKLVSPLPFDPRSGGPVRERWEAGDLELEVQPAGVLRSGSGPEELASVACFCPPAREHASQKAGKCV